MLEKDQTYYVYLYLDPTRTGKFYYKELNLTFHSEPFYVGKGHGSRKYYHVSLARGRLERSESKIDSDCIERCKEILKLGNEPIIFELYSNLLEDEAYSKEDKVIKSIGRQQFEKGPLLNYLPGARYGDYTLTHSEEFRKKVSENHYFNRSEYKSEDHPMFGLKHSEETRRKISKSRMGQFLSDEIKIKISESVKKSIPRGDDHYSRRVGMSEEHRRKLSQATSGANKNKILQIFDVMIKAGHTPSNNKFDKIKYELARSKLHARTYPKWESLPRFITEEEILTYFTRKS